MPDNERHRLRTYLIQQMLWSWANQAEYEDTLHAALEPHNRQKRANSKTLSLSMHRRNEHGGVDTLNRPITYSAALLHDLYHADQHRHFTPVSSLGGTYLHTCGCFEVHGHLSAPHSPEYFRSLLLETLPGNNP